ncbi:hypothetical protein [Streptomyces monashensis]|uniref:Secreted protein n=1 Tax=Streptomyces monashensis TaxID=1678012 RepID=A0A1S2QDQ9_9ACTN|nr:hypothetical protein [Streptomyces monashensis]OIK03475.1 hypothetical protein BIV23_21510 [Streptomyces monashensis]
MKLARSTMMAGAVAGAAGLAVTGITYASAASAPAPQAAPAAAVSAPLGGNGSNNNQNNNNENWGKGNEGKGNEGRGGGERREHREGRVFINERSYSAHPGDCITVVSGLGAKSLNIRNDSHRTVEVFRGAVCDNGAPIATVGPFSDSNGVHACPPEGVHVEHGVLASFRVVRHHGHGGDWD